MPSPVDVGETPGETESGKPMVCHASDEEPFAALGFKIDDRPICGTAYFL